ncbi:MAG: MoaD/ThiS family protein [Thermodesulfobacteriota bacterium]
MSVLIKISSTLRDYVPGYDPVNGLAVPHRPGRTVAEVLGDLGLPVEKVKVLMVNGLSSSPGRILEDGDRVAVFPPVGGG